MFKRKLGEFGESGSRFSLTNISENSKPKSERLETQRKGPMQKAQKIRLIAMSREAIPANTYFRLTNETLPFNRDPEGSVPLTKRQTMLLPTFVSL